MNRLENVCLVILAIALLSLPIWLRLESPGSDYQHLNVIELRLDALEAREK